MLPWLLVNGLILLAAYGLGSIPSGYLAGRWLKGIDIREQGSGSMGATNVLRTLGKIPAAVVLGVDISKGALAIAMVKAVYGGLSTVTQLAEATVKPESVLPWMVTAAGLAALLGHSRPIWLKFRGGKSVASSLGVLVALSWPVALGTAGVFALMLAVTRIVSLSSIMAAVAVSGWMYGLHQPLAYCLFGLLGGLYVIGLHRSNIQRLLAGTEPKIGQKLPEATIVAEK